MKFSDIYFKEDAREDKIEFFLEKFKARYLPNNEIRFSSEDNMITSDEWNELSIEIDNSDTQIEWKSDDEKYSIDGIDEMRTGGIEYMIRFGVRNLFADTAENYTPEDFFDRSLLVEMEDDILEILRNDIKLVFDENIIPPDSARAETSEWMPRSAEAGTYSPAFFNYFDIIEKDYSARKRELGYDEDYFIVVKGKARK